MPTTCTNLIELSTLPKLKTLNVANIKFTSSELEEILSSMTNLESYKIQATILDQPGFSGEKIKAFLPQIDYLKIGQVDYPSNAKLEDPRFLRNSKKALILELQTSIDLQPLLNNCANLQTLSFQEAGLVESINADPKFQCPKHIRNIIFMFDNNNSDETLSYLIRFMSSVKYLETISFHIPLDKSQSLNKLIELHQLEFFKSLKGIKAFIDLRLLKNYSTVLEEYSKQLGQLQNLEALCLNFTADGVFPLKKLVKYLRKLSSLKSLDISFDRGIEGTYYSLDELAFPFADFSNLTHFRLSLPDYYSPDSIKLELEQVMKMENIQVFELHGKHCFERMDSKSFVELFLKLQSLKSIQLLYLSGAEYKKPNYRPGNDSVLFF